MSEKIMTIVERIIAAITVVAGLVTAIKMITHFLEGRRLKYKAKAYLQQEIEDGAQDYVGHSVSVYSPGLRASKKQLVLWGSIFSGGCLGLLILYLVKHRK